MTVATRNTEANVSAGKGVEGGYCFRAPIGTTLPDSPSWVPPIEGTYALTSDTDIVSGKTYYTRSGSGTAASPYVYTAVASPVKASLGTYYELASPGWTCMGFITEDGVSFSTDISISEFNDMNGMPMATSQDSYGETFACSFAETKAATFQSIYGDDSVTDSNGTLTVHHQGAEPDFYAYAFLFTLRNGRKWVRYAEKCKRTEINEVTTAASTVLAWNATFKAFKGDQGDFFTDLFESTETGTSN